MVVSSNEDVGSVSLLSLHGDNIEYDEKQDIVLNKYFEAIIPSIKRNLFRPPMVNFVNKLELSDQKYQTNGNVRDENYQGKLLFTMMEFVSFGKYC